MKLYYMPGACSLASHIACLEAGLSPELHKVIYATKETESGEDFNAINPKGYVPALVLDDGSTLTEGVAVMQYIADQAPDTGLAPQRGTMERYRLQEWLTFIGTELHKGMGPLFNPQLAEADRAHVVEKVRERFDYLSQALGEREYLMGDTFSVADAYAFVMVRWTDMLEIDVSAFPALREFHDRVSSRPAVKKALSAEGLQ